MRIIVVDCQTDRICGDVADVEATLEALEAAPNGDRLERLCKAAARAVDRYRAEQRGAYEFTSFAPREKGPGYFIFLAKEEGENCLHCEACPADVGEVFTRCFYLGYVHRRPQ